MAQAAAHLLPAQRVLEDFGGVSNGPFKEPSSLLLAFGWHNPGHVRVLGDDHAVSLVVFDHELFTNGTS